MSKFNPGRIVGTPGAIAALEESGQTPDFFLDQHIAGNWGLVDKEDWNTNDVAAKGGGRIMSEYVTLKGKKIWIITEAEGDDGKREATTLLLPSEY